MHGFIDRLLVAGKKSEAAWTETALRLLLGAALTLVA